MRRSLVISTRINTTIKVLQSSWQSGITSMQKENYQLWRQIQSGLWLIVYSRKARLWTQVEETQSVKGNLNLDSKSRFGEVAAPEAKKDNYYLQYMFEWVFWLKNKDATSWGNLKLLPMPIGKWNDLTLDLNNKCLWLCRITI